MKNGLVSWTQYHDIHFDKTVRTLVILSDEPHDTQWKYSFWMGLSLHRRVGLLSPETIIIPVRARYKQHAIWCHPAFCRDQPFFFNCFLHSYDFQPDLIILHHATCIWICPCLLIVGSYPKITIKRRNLFIGYIKEPVKLSFFVWVHTTHFSPSFLSADCWWQMSPWNLIWTASPFWSVKKKEARG